MNHNSLIIAADASTARLFRMAQTNDPTHPVDLIEVGAVAASGAADIPACDDEKARTQRALGSYSERIAERAAAFGEHHFCNPVIVVANHELSTIIVDDLERRLPSAPIRPVYAEVAGLPPRELLERLEKHKPFAHAGYPTRQW